MAQDLAMDIAMEIEAVDEEETVLMTEEEDVEILIAETTVEETWIAEEHQ